MSALILLWLLFGGRSSSAPYVFPPPAPSPIPRPPANTVPAQPQVVVVPGVPPAPAPAGPPARDPKCYGAPLGTRPPGNWRPYSPLNAGVIATASEVLRSGVLTRIGPDPARPGKRVYYQRECNPPTYRKVTAWQEA